MTPGEFAAMLFGAELPDGRFIHTWRLSDKRSAWWRSAQALDALAGRENAYIGVSLAHRDHGPSRRLRADEAIAIAGLWLDLDVIGGPTNRDHGAPSKAEAITVASAVLEPTVFVDSGWGIHAWHLLDEPWRFASRAEQSEASLMAARWYYLHAKIARERGWHLDTSTRDLARLMRLPGTVNAKAGGRVPVRVIDATGPRYTRAELAARTAAVPVPATGILAPHGGVSGSPTRGVGGLRFRKGSAPPADKLRALLVNSPEFAATWARQRDDFCGDQSRYDLSLATIAVQAGWTAQEIADLIGAHRGWDAKSFRADYFHMTIAKATTESEAA